MIYVRCNQDCLAVIDKNDKHNRIAEALIKSKAGLQAENELHAVIAAVRGSLQPHSQLGVEVCILLITAVKSLTSEKNTDQLLS